MTWALGGLIIVKYKTFVHMPSDNSFTGNRVEWSHLWNSCRFLWVGLTLGLFLSA